MFGRVANLERVRRAAESTDEHPPLAWLDDPPAGYLRLARSVMVGEAGQLAGAGQALLQWGIQRGAGLRVAAVGPAEVGATVAVGLRLGLMWMMAPCRVVAVDHTPERVGFAYATLPGHPESGVERFQLRVDGAGLRFEVDAVSRPTALVGRLAPYPARWVQQRVTKRYVEAARHLAST